MQGVDRLPGGGIGAVANQLCDKDVAPVAVAAWMRFDMGQADSVLFKRAKGLSERTWPVVQRKRDERAVVACRLRVVRSYNQEASGVVQGVLHAVDQHGHLVQCTGKAAADRCTVRVTGGVLHGCCGRGGLNPLHLGKVLAQPAGALAERLRVRIHTPNARQMG